MQALNPDNPGRITLRDFTTIVVMLLILAQLALLPKGVTSHHEPKHAKLATAGENSASAQAWSGEALAAAADPLWPVVVERDVRHR